MKSHLLLLLLFVSFVAAAPKDMLSKIARNEVEISFHDHDFMPQKFEVSAGQPVLLRVVNDSQERIEFESFKLHREVVVSAGDSVLIHLPALTPGKYDFFDDFDDDVPDGQIIAR